MARRDCVRTVYSPTPFWFYIFLPYFRQMRRSSRILKPLFEQLDAARSNGELEGTATRGGGITEAFIKVSDDFRDMRYVVGGGE